MPTTSNGIYYEEHGAGPVTMLMLPGLGCSIDCWSRVTPLLDGFRFVLMDLPGHAGSFSAEVDGTNLGTVAKPVIDSLDELGLERFAVVGLSFGGALAVRIALDRPDQVLAVVALMPWNAGGADAGDLFMEQFYNSFGDTQGITQAIHFISLDPSKTTDVVRTMSTAVTEQFWRGWYGGGVYTSMAAELPEIAVPVCYVIGGRDAVAPQDKLMNDVRAMPGGRLVFLAEAGHLAPYEHPQLVAAEIREFVDRQVGSSNLTRKDMISRQR